MLAVANNPELKLARTDLKLAKAQAFSAGLLPDPSFNLTADFPHPKQPGLSTAFNAGISFDLGAFFVAPSKQSSAEADVEKTDLALLWQEWQVASQARQLFVKLRSQAGLQTTLQGMLDAQSRRYDLADAALREGNLSADALGPYLIAREDWRKQLADAKRQTSTAQHDLNALLGLAPETRLDLVGPSDVAPLDEAEVRHELTQIAHRRPDLIALEAGYRGQEDKLRGAILSQFPAITIGPTRARDTSRLYTTGLAAGISLPIFNRNRGNIAIETATREKMKQEYDNRLHGAAADIDKLLADQRLLEAQWHEAQATVPQLQATLQRADAALKSREITITSYVDLQTALATKQVEIIGLEQSVEDQRIAITTLLGGELPTRQPKDPATP